ncbi:MAG: cytidine 5'-phosphate N-acetylneuraminic acid synthetase [Desulfovibrio sp.]|nr:cytidine 5'-phosphate N-acetylneuraminic acid synthetase [Desulfovibrio sp.]
MRRCVVIPAVKKNAVIPDQLVKKLAGVPLINRAIDTAKACVRGEDIYVFTDSEEIGLICERAGVRHVRNPAFRFKSYDIVSEMGEFLAGLTGTYEDCVILRASCPLLTWVDIEDAWSAFKRKKTDCLITVRKIKQRLWRSGAETLDEAVAQAAVAAGQDEYVAETRALIIIRLAALGDREAKIMPWFLGERSIEILDYQDWWICERLLERRRVVFVVAGYPAIGMGHVYRALMLAHEISAHKIEFVCTRSSELGAAEIAARDYRVIRQGDENLAATVLGRRPDLVVNDFLNAPVNYMRALKEANVRTINFEDDGEGARLADLVINALYEDPDPPANVRCGPSYFCLRDEFLYATRNPLRPDVRVVLITFGGTDQRNFTLKVLNVIEPICRAFGIAIRIVTGPGYAHKERLEKRLAELENPLITFAWATNIMSRMMEGADLALSSAGRTVYELAHMRSPGIVFATHEREARHGFARARNGFAFAGLMDRVDDRKIRNIFLAMLKQKRRARYWERQDRLSFAGNKQRVVGLMEDQLEKTRTE